MVALENTANEEGKKPRLLVLHGWRSNSDISDLQLSNLGLDKQFEITHLHGPFTSEVAENELMEAMSTNKTFYSWLSQKKYKSDEEMEAELVTSLTKVMTHVLSRGRPYDAVYGFSQGAMIASLLSCDILRLGLLQSEFKKDYDLAWLLKKNKQGPWKSVINACASNRSHAWELCANRFGFEFPSDDEADKDFFKSGFILFPSVHIIGGQDTKHKKKSKAISKMYNKKEGRKVFTLEDVGHEIPASVQKNHADIPEQIKEWFTTQIVEREEEERIISEISIKSASIFGSTLRKLSLRGSGSSRRQSFGGSGSSRRQSLRGSGSSGRQSLRGSGSSKGQRHSQKANSR